MGLRRIHSCNVNDIEGVQFAGSDRLDEALDLRRTQFPGSDRWALIVHVMGLARSL
jgi:hypothetical protein